MTKQIAALAVVMSALASSVALPTTSVAQSINSPARHLSPGALPADQARPNQRPIILAQAISEKEAFEAAKELGTIEAWEAFLNNFPRGFRADLARAYVRRLGNSSGNGALSQPTETQPPRQPTTQSAEPKPLPAGRNEASPAFADVRFNVLFGYWRKLATTRYFAAGRVGYPLCMQECAKSRSCNFWVFQPRNPNYQGSVDRCFLMAEAGRAVPASWCPKCTTGRRIGVPEPQLTQPNISVASRVRWERKPPAFLGRPKRPKTTRPPKTKPTSSRPRCTRGRVYRRGACRCPRSRRFWYGGRCNRFRDCPGDSVRNRKGQCVKEDEPPVVRNRCSGGRLFSQSRRICHCPESRPVWTGSRCISARPTGGATNQQIIRRCKRLNRECQRGLRGACRALSQYCDRG
ncbi:MAG: hypothetical protein AAFY53_10575 [Pseudomonadota bacterium]